jgi:DNA polymerase-3 subunit beta
MTATDLDVSLVTRLEVDILRSGSICLSGKKLGQITGALPNEPVHLKLDYKTEKVEFLAGRFKGKLAGVDTDQFPEVLRVGAEPSEITASVFYEGLRRTSFAVTDNDSRFTINGILLLIEKGELKMVSTDGHRLCLFRMMLTTASSSDLNCLIPIKAVRELLRILSKELKLDKESEIIIKKGSHLEFEIGKKVLIAREVVGNFPNWEKVVPSEFESFSELNAKNFFDALIRVGILADDKNRRIDLTFFSNKVQLKAESSEVGFSTEEVPCTFRYLDDSVSGEDSLNGGLKIAFNAKYLMDFFAVHSTKDEKLRVVWKFGVNGSQTELKFEGEEQMFSYILVPLKV